VFPYISSKTKIFATDKSGNTLKQFIYKFDDGPFSTKEFLDGEWATGNCRRAVQYYLWKKRRIFLSPEQILCPKAYRETGVFVVKPDDLFSFKALEDGDIVYAERIRPSEKKYSGEDAFLISLHTTIFTGIKTKEIWHATATDGQSCFWEENKFLKHYRPIAAKRIMTT
jgi:hypothetical protein